MRLHRFFVDFNISQIEFSVKDERLVHQWRNVFRYNTGSEVILFNGSGYEYDCLIQNLNNREAVLEVVRKREGVLPKNKITLYQSIIKKDKMEWIVEKATELGVSKIVPIISERSEKKDLNLERMQKIAIEAAEQCGRADVPEIESSIQDLESSIQEKLGQIIVFDSSGVPLGSSFQIPASIFIGPEGGWSEKELDLFKQKGAKIYSLGPLTLRAETAAIVALASAV